MGVTKYCKDRFCADWVKLESVAKQQKKGMWQDSAVMLPWEWRAAKREGKQEQESAPVIMIGGSKHVSAGSSSGQYRCDGRTHCLQMISCDEEKFFLRNCPGVKMNGNNDGVLCERQWCR